MMSALVLSCRTGTPSQILDEVRASLILGTILVNEYVKAVRTSHGHGPQNARPWITPRISHFRNL